MGRTSDDRTEPSSHSRLVAMYVTALCLFIVMASQAAIVPVVDGVARGIIIGVMVLLCVCGGAVLGMARAASTARRSARDGDPTPGSGGDSWLPSRDGAGLGADVASGVESEPSVTANGLGTPADADMSSDLETSIDLETSVALETPVALEGPDGPARGDRP